MNLSWASVMILSGAGYCKVMWFVIGIALCFACFMVMYQVFSADSISSVLFPSRSRSSISEMILFWNSSQFALFVLRRLGPGMTMGEVDIVSIVGRWSLLVRVP